MLVTGMVALHYNTLSMIIVSRNVANLVLMIGDYIAFRQYPDIYVATIYNLLLAGAIIAALQQHTFSVTRTGLIWMMANCFCTAAYILCMKHIITTTTTSATAGTYSTYPSSSSCNHNHGSLPLTQPQASGPLSGSARKSTGMIPVYSIIYIHNALCIVFLLPAAYMMGEISLFAASTAIHTTEYASKTVIAGILCFIFNYALLNCVEQQSTHPHHHSHDGTHTSTHGVPQKHRRPSLSERHSKNVLV
jgi:GDP-mannose transporter